MEVIAILLLLVITSSVRAQVGAASLSGVVQDPTGAVIPGATASLVNQQTGEERSAPTSGQGGFLFAAVPAGDYNLTVSHSGFHTYTLVGIHLNAGDSKLLN